MKLTGTIKQFSIAFRLSLLTVFVLTANKVQATCSDHPYADGTNSPSQLSLCATTGGAQVWLAGHNWEASDAGVTVTNWTCSDTNHFSFGVDEDDHNKAYVTVKDPDNCPDTSVTLTAEGNISYYPDCDITETTEHFGPLSYTFTYKKNGCGCNGGGGGGGGGGPGGGPSFGGGSCANNSVDILFPLGRFSYGQSAGLLEVNPEASYADLCQPTSLYVPFPIANSAGAMDIVTNVSGVIQQVKVPEGLINVVVANSWKYQLQFFYPTNVTAKVGGLYGTNAAAFDTWTIENPDTTTSSNRLLVTEQHSGMSDRHFTYTFTNDSGNIKCILADGDGMENISTWWATDPDDSTLTNHFREVRMGSTLIQRTERSYKTINDRRLVVRVIDGTGLVTNITGYTYYSDGNLQGVYYPDGNWEYYDYDDQNRITTNYSAYGNFSPPAPGVEPNPVSDHCKMVQYNYSAHVTGDGDTNGFPNPNLARLETTSIPVQNGGGSWSVQEVSRIYRSSPSWYETVEIRCPTPGASWNNPSNVWTRTVAYSDQAETNENGLAQFEMHSDGTATVYNYTFNANHILASIISQTGVPNVTNSLTDTPTNIIDGTQTETDLNSSGQITQVTVKTIVNSVLSTILSSQTYTYSGLLQQDYQVVDLAGRTNQYHYACCGLESTLDPDGVAVLYGYDDLRRIASSTVLRGSDGITTTNALDPLGRILQTTRIGSDGSSIMQAQNQYDILGRLIAQSNPLGGITTTTNAVINNQLYVTNVYANGGTRIEQHYRDGKLQSIIGTAVHSVQYVYGAEQDTDGTWRQYILEVHPDVSGGTNEWNKTYYDGVSHAYKTVYSASSQPYPFSRSFYNGFGQMTKQVDPDGIVTLYQYNAKSELSYAAVDMNHNDTIDFAGTDHINFATNDVVGDHGTNVRRTRNYVWATTNLDSSTLISVNETSTDGLKTWQVNYRDANTTVTNSTTISPGDSRTELAVTPDGSYTISTYSYDQLVSAYRYDSSSSQIGGTTYTYDAHGRQHQMTDARNGATTYSYNNADLVTNVTTPSPGGGGSSQTTTTSYNAMLQATNVVQPDSTSVTTEYYLTGEQKRNFGSRAYPVAYSYDYDGRMKTMTNWSNFSGNSGARVTTWSYDVYRGLLSGKTYDGGAAGPSYTYTAAGRLTTRTWARGVVTTYSYDNVGSLSAVVYSDSTPAVTNSYDRLGRQGAVTWNGITDTLAYNLVNELLSESYSGGSLAGLAITNSYDQFMRRTNLTALTSGVLNRAIYSYDAASRLSTVSDGVNNANYSYVANSPLVSQIVFKQNSTTRMTTTKSYDYLNRLTQISSTPSGAAAVSFNYAYNNANQRTNVNLADGSYWIYSYDSLGQVTSGKKYWSDGTPVAGQQFDYSFDDIGNRTQTKSGGDQTGANQRTANYYANNLNQLTNRDVPAYVDIKGTSTTNVVTVNGSTAYRKGDYFRDELPANNSSSALWTNITVAAPGRTNVTGNVYVPKEPELFKYDSDGNLTNDGHWAYTWDGENRLIKMAVNIPVGPQYQLIFAYDSKGRRIQKTVMLTGVGIYTNRFLYDGWNLISEIKPDNSLLRSYVWGTDLSGTPQGAGGVGGLLEMSYCGTSTTNCFPAYDGNGNISALANAADGTIAANYEYGVFGEPTRMTGTIAKINLFRFSTKYNDDESDLLYFGYRYYKPSTGTWINRDPIYERGFRTSNKILRNTKAKLKLEYVFTANRPISLRDYLGLDENTPTAFGPISGTPTGDAYVTSDDNSPLAATTTSISIVLMGPGENGSGEDGEMGPFESDRWAPMLDNAPAGCPCAIKYTCAQKCCSLFGNWTSKWNGSDKYIYGEVQSDLVYSSSGYPETDEDGRPVFKNAKCVISSQAKEKAKTDCQNSSTGKCNATISIGGNTTTITPN